MICTEFEDRLHDQFEAAHVPRGARFGSGASADLAEHAGECETCRALYERFQLLADCLGAWREQIPEVDLAQAVMAAHQLQATEAEPLLAAQSAPPADVPSSRPSIRDEAQAAAV